jgi:hypothetical protein
MTAHCFCAKVVQQYFPEFYFLWFLDQGICKNTFVCITIFSAEGIWKVHIFSHLFVCFQTSVYTLGEFQKKRNNSTVFEELSVSIVDLTVANICFTGSASRRQ